MPPIASAGASCPSVHGRRASPDGPGAPRSFPDPVPRQGATGTGTAANRTAKTTPAAAYRSPRPACSRQAVREPAHRTSKRYDPGHNACTESAIRRISRAADSAELSRSVTRRLPQVPDGSASSILAWPSRCPAALRRRHRHPDAQRSWSRSFASCDVLLLKHPRSPRPHPPPYGCALLEPRRGPRIPAAGTGGNPEPILSRIRSPWRWAPWPLQTVTRFLRCCAASRPHLGRC
jgi:hypothetical protein